MGLLNRQQTFPESLELSGIVFRYTGQSYENNDRALSEAYFVRKRGYYARIVKRNSTLDGRTLYGVYAARKE